MAQRRSPCWTGGEEETKDSLPTPDESLYGGFWRLKGGGSRKQKMEYPPPFFVFLFFFFFFSVFLVMASSGFFLCFLGFSLFLGFWLFSPILSCLFSPAIGSFFPSSILFFLICFWIFLSLFPDCFFHSSLWEKAPVPSVFF